MKARTFFRFSNSGSTFWHFWSSYKSLEYIFALMWTLVDFFKRKPFSVFSSQSKWCWPHLPPCPASPWQSCCREQDFVLILSVQPPAPPTSCYSPWSSPALTLRPINTFSLLQHPQYLIFPPHCGQLLVSHQQSLPLVDDVHLLADGDVVLGGGSHRYLGMLE